MSWHRRYCLTWASAAFAVLLLVVFSFIVVPLFFVMVTQSPQLAEEYRQNIEKVMPAVYVLLAMIAIDLLCAAMK
jgi:hypothetical protein